MRKLRCAQKSLSYPIEGSEIRDDVKKYSPTERTPITLKRTPKPWAGGKSNHKKMTIPYIYLSNHVRRQHALQKRNHKHAFRLKVKTRANSSKCSKNEFTAIQNNNHQKNWMKPCHNSIVNNSTLLSIVTGDLRLAYSFANPLIIHETCFGCDIPSEKHSEISVSLDFHLLRCFGLVHCASWLIFLLLGLFFDSTLLPAKVCEPPRAVAVQLLILKKTLS